MKQNGVVASQDPRPYSYISIWIFDFGPEKLAGLSRNGPQLLKVILKFIWATKL